MEPRAGGGGAAAAQLQGTRVAPRARNEQMQRAQARATKETSQKRGSTRTRIQHEINANHEQGRAGPPQVRNPSDRYRHEYLPAHSNTTATTTGPRACPSCSPSENRRGCGRSRSISLTEIKNSQHHGPHAPRDAAGGGAGPARDADHGLHAREHLPDLHHQRQGGGAGAASFAAAAGFFCFGGFVRVRMVLLRLRAARGGGGARESAAPAAPRGRARDTAAALRAPATREARETDNNTISTQAQPLLDKCVEDTKSETGCLYYGWTALGRSWSVAANSSST